jgi:regulator of sigma E protease
MKALGGPILIADLARRSAKLGLTRFLELMALISINLFLLNLFPIPILDGGHIFVFFTYEAIARRPMPVRWVERFNQVGFVVIMLLMLVTFINDSSRYNLFSLRK